MNKKQNLKNKRKNLNLLLLILFLIALCICSCQFLPVLPEKAKWTVLVYMDADNDLERWAIDDFNEMETVSSLEDVNIIVQTDRIPKDVLNSYGYYGIDDSSNGDWTTARRYLITEDSDIELIHSILLEDLGEIDMGSPEALRNFGYWGIANYPADKYFIILWNHGNGFRSITQTRGISWDLTNNNNYLAMSELSDAFAFIANQAGKKIDIIGMDACLMAMTEVAYQIKDSSDILIASADNIPIEGWNYQDVFDIIVQDPEISPEELAFEIIDIAFHDSEVSTGNLKTQSAINLDYMTQLSQEIDLLAQSIIADNDTPIEDYLAAVEITQTYNDIDFIDLKDFAANIANTSGNSSVVMAAKEIVETMSLGKAIINYGIDENSFADSYGLSIYFPLDYYDSIYDELDFSHDTMWVEMINKINL